MDISIDKDSLASVKKHSEEKFHSEKFLPKLVSQSSLFTKSCETFPNQTPTIEKKQRDLTQEERSQLLRQIFLVEKCSVFERYEKVIKEQEKERKHLFTIFNFSWESQVIAPIKQNADKQEVLKTLCQNVSNRGFPQVF